jgi:c(7)-type cytochrome triheme protein
MPEPPAQESPSAVSPALPRKRRLLSLLVLALSCVAVGLGLIREPKAAFSADALALTLAAGTHSTAESPSSVENSSRFSHSSSAHARLRCSACHRREDNTPRSLWLGHRPCSSCHSQKFASLKDPICTTCHATPEPRSAEIKSFAGLKSFSAGFDHSRHANVGCGTCHKPASRGVALSIPGGPGAHTTCFQCHSSGASAQGRDLSSCDVCHSAGRHARTGILAKAYKLNFSHAEHGARNKLNCNDCHRVRPGAAPGRMTRPFPAMHRAASSTQSCASCHNDKRAFGGDDFADCKRCHQGPTFRF